MTDVHLQLPDQSIGLLGGSPETAASALRLAAAMKLYEIGRLSAGAAAELAGISKPDFLTRLSTFGIDTFRQSDAEIRREADNALRL